MKKQELKLREELQCLVNDYNLNNNRITKTFSLFANDNHIGILSFTSIRLSKKYGNVNFYEDENINFTMSYENFKGKLKLFYYSEISKSLYYKINF